MKLLSGNSNRPLAKAIAVYLETPLTNADVRRFSDMEVFVEIHENVRGEDVFIIQSTSSPANDNLMELLVCIDALRRASARRITAVLPYFGYARQDRKPGPRTPISAKLVANLIATAGANRVLTMDLHAGQIQGFFNIPVDHLFAAPVILDYFESVNLPNVTIVSPDAGGVERARFFAKQLKTDLAIIDKRRVDANEAEIMNIIGDIQGKDVVILDDMVDTAGTLVKAAQALRDQGAKKIFAAITHPILSGPAISRLESSVLEKLIVTNSIKIGPEKRIERLEILSVASLMGEAICSIHEETSVSRLFIS